VRDRARERTWEREEEESYPMPRYPMRIRLLPSASCYLPVLMSHPKTKCAVQGTVLPQGSRPKSEQLLHQCEQVQQLRAGSAEAQSTCPHTRETLSSQRSWPESWPESTPSPPPALELAEAGTVLLDMTARFINATASRYCFYGREPLLHGTASTVGGRGLYDEVGGRL
jgi:hypothetical protein